MKQVLLALSLLIAPLSWTTAQNAIDFDGTNDYVQTTFSGVSGSANRTFEAWIYVPSGISGNKCILDYGANAVGSRNTFSINSSYQLVYISGGTNANISSSSNAVTPNQWTHVAFVLNNGTGYFYANGVAVGNGNLSAVNTPTGMTNLRIGQRVPGGSIPFDGIIDEVRIWDVARTATDLTASMNSEYCSYPTGLLAYYKFNSGVAGGNNSGVTTATDAVSSNNGTLTNFSLSGSSSNWVTGKSLNTGSSTPGNASVTACDSYTSPSGNYTWTTSGSYIDTISSATGCDSIVNITLTVNQSSTGSLTATACNKYISPSGNHTWTASGSYTDTLMNAIGCDSVLSIALTVNTVDTSILVNGITLTSWAAGATYQWLDCNNGFSPVSGATNQSFTATANGSYAVEINDNGCIDTSACYAINTVGLEENETNEIAVYPNPSKSNGSIHIVFGGGKTNTSFELTSVSGSVVYKGEFGEEQKQELELNLPAGTYILTVRQSSAIVHKKVVVQ